MRDRASAVRRALRRVPPGRAREWLRDLLLHGDRGRAQDRVGVKELNVVKK